MRIDKATHHDLTEVLALFDQAQTWLHRRGLSGQWGTVPFSTNPAIVTRFQEWIGGGHLHVARSEETVLGTLAINPQPPAYLAAQCAPYLRQARYLEAFTTHRDHAGQGVGKALLQWAEATARQQGIDWLQLDCWAGNPNLRRYYQRAGFAEVSIFTLGTWQGMLFEKYIGGSADTRAQRKSTKPD